MKRLIYADNAATTRLSKAAFDAMIPWLLDEYGNASQPYVFARKPKQALAEAREIIAGCINAQSEEIFFTSGGTESDNWAIKGVAFANAQKAAIITSAFEHHAVLHSCAAMEDALTAYPAIDVVYGVSTVCQLGAYDAVDAARRTDEVTIVGWDNSAEDKQIIDSGSCYLGAVAVDAAYEMNICLEKVEKNADGEEIERISNYYPKIYTANGFVSAEDILK